MPEFNKEAADSLQASLEYLRDANSQNNQKGKLLVEWFEKYLSESVAVSYIKAANQIGNRFKEQKGKNAPNTVFLFDDLELMLKSLERINEYVSSGHSRIYFFTHGAKPANDFTLQRRLLATDVDPLDSLVGDTFGKSTIEQLPTTPCEASTLSGKEKPMTGSSQVQEYHQVKPKKGGKFPLAEPLQRILHGCPGSGKSYQLNEESEEANFVIRTVFHPETRYSDFVGGLRPESIYRLPSDDSEQINFEGATGKVPGEPYVQYVVQPGPLLKAYHLACLNADKSVVLIIEELSRAVAAHVFGDMIQLLDRRETEGSELLGYSEYEIEPKPELRAWLTFRGITHEKVSSGNMRFPPNLYIWATMNRSDQNARQLDSAFLRRWSKRYFSFRRVGVYDDLKVKYGGSSITWGDLRSKINVKLQETEGVPEDKFIGPYFVSKRRLEDSEAIYEDLWGYIWNDVLKSRASSFFDGAATFAELHEVWDNGNGSPIGPTGAQDLATTE